MKNDRDVSSLKKGHPPRAWSYFFAAAGLACIGIIAGSISGEPLFAKLMIELGVVYLVVGLFACMVGWEIVFELIFAIIGAVLIVWLLGI